jgi:hypothetical protein
LKKHEADILAAIGFDDGDLAMKRAPAKKLRCTEYSFELSEVGNSDGAQQFMRELAQNTLVKPLKVAPQKYGLYRWKLDFISSQVCALAAVRAHERGIRIVKLQGIS